MTKNEQYTLILQAIARGYCDAPNHQKIVDPVLCESMAREVQTLLPTLIMSNDAPAEQEVTQEARALSARLRDAAFVNVHRDARELMCEVADWLFRLSPITPITPPLVDPEQYRLDGPKQVPFDGVGWNKQDDGT